MTLLKSIVIAVALVCSGNAFVVTPPPAPRSSTSLEALPAALSGNLGILVGVGAAAVAGIAGFTMRNKDGSDDSSSSTTTSSSSKAGEPAKIDVSIPYNAAARLAYDEWKKSNASSKAGFEQYEPLYIKKTVADVTAKKVTRDMELAVKEAQAAAKSVDAELAQL